MSQISGNSSKELSSKKSKNKDKLFYKTKKARLRILNSTTCHSSSIKQNNSREIKLEFSKGILNKTLLKLKGEQTREIGFNNFNTPEINQSSRNSILQKHFKTEASNNSRASISNANFTKKESEVHNENKKSKIKLIPISIDQQSSEFDDLLSVDDIPVIEKLRMNIGQMTFDKASKIFPLKLNMTSEDEYILAKDEFFLQNPQLKEFANLKLMKRK